MKTIEDSKKDFRNEKCLNVAEPLVRATKSWVSLEDTGDEAKARELHFDALKGNVLYMANILEKNKAEYAKLYIVAPGHKSIWSVYVKKDILCPGERYHHVTQT